jgi:hypothetical protein
MCHHYSKTLTPRQAHSHLTREMAGAGVEGRPWLAACAASSPGGHGGGGSTGRLALARQAESAGRLGKPTRLL